MTKQEQLCMECRWCCEHEVHRINANYGCNIKDVLNIYVYKRLDLMYDPLCRAWFAVYNKPCMMLGTKEFGCMLHKINYKPILCKVMMCPHPEQTMKKMYPIFKKASENILKRIFPGIINVNNDSIKYIRKCKI